MGHKKGPTPAPEFSDDSELSSRIIDAAPAGIVVVNADGSIHSANPPSLQLLGMSHDELTNRYTSDFETETIFEDGRPCPVSEYPVTKALITGEAQPDVTIGVRRPDGEVAWAVFSAVPVKDANGVITGAVVTLLDVTARKAAEAQLRASEATLRSVLDSAPTLVITTDCEGTIQWVNRSVVPGRTAESWIGTSIYDRVAPSDIGLVRGCIEGVIASGKPDGYEIQVDYDGTPVAYSVRVGPVTHGDQVTGITMIATDVTEVRALQSRVMISDRLASIGTLAAGVAHEINNPLTYVLLSLDRAINTVREVASPTLRNRLEHSLDSALEGLERIRNLVRDLGSFSRSWDAEIEPVDIAEVLELAIQMSDHETRCRAKLVRRYGSVPKVMGDRSRLGQVFLNLLVNAAHAIDAGDVANNEIVIATRMEGERVCVTVSDTGRGIPPDMVDHVFEPFVTSKEMGRGTGLGLYICHKIVESVGGELRVSSSLGEGTSISVLLPPTNQRPTPEATEVNPALPMRELRILVVDDEQPIREFFGVELSEHNVTLAANGREALEALRNSAYDLVFCDLIMPDLTGMDVHEYLCREKPGDEDAVVFMTGGAFTQRASEFLHKTAARVLEKPFQLADVRRIIERTSRRTSSDES